MKKFLRRSGAALLTACTVWVVIATVESNSVAAAATALRDSFHLPTALMRLELGDLPGDKEMSLSTLLCLGQSPLLWTAYGQLPEEDPPAAEPQPVPAQPQPQPQPALSDENEWTQGLSFTDNGAPSQTVIPTASKSYTVAGNVYIKNSSDHTIDTSLLDGTFPAKLGDSTQPQVLILHTHGSEAYTMPAGEEYTPSGSYRTADTEKNMIRVGDEIARTRVGIKRGLNSGFQIFRIEVRGVFGKFINKFRAVVFPLSGVRRDFHFLFCKIFLYLLHI